MKARQWLRRIQTDAERDPELAQDSVLISISGTEENARAIIALNVEGKVKLFEIVARELGVYEGLDAAV